MNFDKNDILFSVDELKKIASNFADELTKANSNEPTSLQFLKNTLPDTDLIKKDEIFQIFTLGGSNFENALIQNKENDIEILDHKISPFKGFENFFEFLKSNLHPEVTWVAINFAYPVIPVVRDHKLDGRLIKATKEHSLTQLEGKIVGEEIEKYFLENANRKINVVLANDTICLALAGKFKDKSLDIIGGVVGTGVNFSIFLNENTIVNLESGNFDKFEFSESGKIIDEKSLIKGGQKFEKEVSGRYLYEHFNIIKNQLGIDIEDLKDTKEIDVLAMRKHTVEGKLADAILERSASLVAAQIYGICQFKKTNKITAVIEGSLFWRGLLYKEKVEYYMEKFELSKDKVNFYKIEKSSIYGASKLLNQ